jgi:hypothetical protein
VILPPRTGGQMVKEAGELLWPEREGRVELDAANQRLRTFGYACQYQQNPIARGGNLFKVQWLNHYREMPDGFDEKRDEP